MGEPDLAAGLPGLAAPLDRLRDFCATACLNPNDKGCVTALELVEACEGLLIAPPGGRDLDQLAAALFGLPTKTNKTAPGGTKSSWDATRGGKEELQVRYQALVAAIVALREQYAASLTGLAVAVADSFSRWAGAAQLAQGRLDFTDLLGCLRDLLKRDRTARRALQGRLDYLLVDEFQDTDPLQSEIVFFLSEREAPAGESSAEDARADDWREVVLKAGKLFVVGDPKQSIYRFRRADIALYDKVKRCIADQPDGRGVVLAISRNFRTTPALVDWVNGVFTAVFDDDQEEGRQPGYRPVEAFRPPADGARVAVLLGRPYGNGAGQADAARRDEARAVAALLARMRGDDAGRWQVQDREGHEASAGLPARDGAAPDDSEPLRPLRWGDVALLFRATTGLETYEQALREAGVPYRVEGGKAYFERREVDDALLCLRAVDDPSDGPAIYGALHSSLFGFSDDDLFLFGAARWTLRSVRRRTAGRPRGDHCRPRCPARPARTSLRQRTPRAARRAGAPRPRCGAPRGDRLRSRPSDRQPRQARRARASLRRRRRRRSRRLPCLGRRGRRRRRRAGVAGRRRRRRGPPAHHPQGQGPRVSRRRAHRWRVGQAGRAGGEPLVDRDNQRLAIKLKAELPGAAARDLEPQAYTTLSEREKVMSASEKRRLLYVAATRARDRLVVTQFGKLTTQGGEAVAGALLGPIADALPEAAVITEEYVAGGVMVLPPTEPPVVDARDEAAPDAATMVAARGAWLAARTELLARAALPARATSPSGLEHVDEQVRSGGPGAPPGRAQALALGSAVHRVMELCDLHDQLSIAPLAEAAARDLGRPDLAAEAAALAGACWRAAPVRAAAAAAADPSAVYRELAIGVLLDDIVVSGAVDLLYRDGQEWVVVDYKTDRGADDGVLRERYTPQGAAYAVAVEAATGGVVREVVFVAARADGLVVSVPVDDSLRDLARREAEMAAGAGRALAADQLADG